MQGLESVSVDCPYCGEPIELTVDTSVAVQSYVEDCPVCCQPMVVSTRVGTALEVRVEPENG